MWTEVRRHPDSAWLRERILVLESVGIPSRVARNGSDQVLLVPTSAWERAERELSLFEAEADSQPVPATRPVPPLDVRRAIPGIVIYLLLVGGFHFLVSQTSWGHELIERGKTDAQQIRDGAWWRTVSALFLHADATHLASNMFFGALFGGLMSMTLGNARAWGSILFGGAAGNFCNAWIRDSGHTSIGASTAVFAALGMLAAYPWRQRSGRSLRSVDRWAPLVLGLVLLGLIGGGGERTDVTAHGLGMLLGIGMGSCWAKLAPTSPTRGAGTIGLAALACVALAWWLALRG